MVIIIGNGYPGSVSIPQNDPKLPNSVIEFCKTTAGKNMTGLSLERPYLIVPG